MTPAQFQIVKLTFAQAMTERREVGRDFYRRLFVLAPDLRARFRGDIETEIAKLNETLVLSIISLKDMSSLVVTLDALARRGVGRGLNEHHYRAIGQSLLWAIERRIGAAFTPCVSSAWLALLAVVVTFLRGPAIGLRRSRAA